MATFFLVVTDLELLASQAVKFILLALLLFGGGLNLFKVWKERQINRKVIRGTITIVLFALSIPVIKWIQIEGSLLNSGEYTVGTTIGPCQVFAKGSGIEFEYEVEGKKYRNCNTFHPISINDITVPNGKYLVRYSDQYPGEGRIDFHKKVE